MCLGAALAPALEPRRTALEPPADGRCWSGRSSYSSQPEAKPGRPETRYHRIVSATGPLQLIQAFANTLGASPSADQLGTREEAPDWLRAAGLLPAEAGLSNSEYAALLRLRESIRDVLAAHTGGREDADAAARLTRALADGRLVLTVDPASAVQLASAARASYPNLVAVVAIAIAGAAASGAWPGSSPARPRSAARPSTTTRTRPPPPGARRTARRVSGTVVSCRGAMASRRTG
jgi:Putative stress-induced transcription regulator